MRDSGEDRETPAMLLRHKEIWQAIDALARDHGYTVSALARRAGLDASSFNKSKRASPDGRPRWPSLESLAKILDATGVTPLEFFAYSGSPAPEPKRAPARRLPAMDQRRAGERDPFDADGLPAGKHWDLLPFPDVPDRHSYGIVVSGDAAEPVFRDGDLLVASPRAALKRGDRALVRSISGRLRACEFLRRTSRSIEIRGFDGKIEQLDAKEIAFAHRIVWAAQ